MGTLCRPSATAAVRRARASASRTAGTRRAAARGRVYPTRPCVPDAAVCTGRARSFSQLRTRTRTQPTWKTFFDLGHVVLAHVNVSLFKVHPQPNKDLLQLRASDFGAHDGPHRGGVDHQHPPVLVPKRRFRLRGTRARGKGVRHPRFVGCCARASQRVPTGCEGCEGRRPPREQPTPRWTTLAHAQSAASRGAKASSRDAPSGASQTA